MNKSYLQWAGSKNKALKHLLPIIKEFKFNTFVEPFVGAANVSLNVDAKQYVWNDFNEDLFLSHRQVLRDTENYLYHSKVMFEYGFSYYEEFRNRFNERNIDNPTYHAALFQYLNKHGFNGLCRYNKTGKYNVPVGTITKNPKKVPEDQIKYFKERFQGKTLYIDNKDFSEVIRTSDNLANTLIYNDPPYVPAGASNFNYTANGFSIEEQERLVLEAKRSPHNVLISNHWNEETENLYKDADKVWTFPVQRTISRDGNNRKQVEECVVLYGGE